MAVMVLACPACGRQSTFDGASFGDKIRCACGMTFTASPVFAVSPWSSAWSKTAKSRFSFVLAAMLLALAGGLAAWTLNKPNRPTPASTLMTQVPSRPIETPPTPPVTPPDLPPKDDTKPPEPVPSKPPEPAPPKEPEPTPKPSPPPPKPPALPPLPNAAKSTPVKLFDAFENAEKGKSKFAGQWVELTGVPKVERDASGTEYLGFVVVSPRKLTPEQLSKLDPREQDWEKSGYPPNVCCYFDGDEEVPNLKPGASITIRGIVRGRRDDPGIYMSYAVTVAECRVLK